jgi:hypothetical protein
MSIRSRTRRWTSGVAAAALGLVTLGASECPMGAQALLSDDPSTLPVPVVDRGSEKFLQVEMLFDPVEVRPITTTTEIGYFRKNVGDPPLLRVDVFDDAGNLADTYNSWHPQWAHVDDFEGGESLEIVAEGTGEFRCAFEPDLRSLVLTDLTGAAPVELAEVDLRPAIRSFCEDNPDDADCEVADLAILEVSVQAAPPLIVLGVPFAVGVRTTLSNLGPSSPIDAVLEKTAAPGAGVQASPLLVEQHELELFVGTPRIDDQAYEVSCSAPGDTSIEFTSRTELLTVAATDPEPGNNEGGENLDLDCVVPVTINIKPGGDPNSVNLNSRHVPVGILSTGAGEGGNPIAFDATRIDVSTVRFGPRDVLIGGGGSGESHGRLHLEDVLELDDVTRDGDTDAVVHLLTDGSGLTRTSTEACVLGRFVTSGGVAASFLGCDSVRIVPPR